MAWWIGAPTGDAVGAGGCAAGRLGGERARGNDDVRPLGAEATLRRDALRCLGDEATPIEEGREEGLRVAIEAFCEALAIALDDARRAWLATASAAALDARLADLRATRAWR